MSPLIWKELRLLGPSWLIALFGVTALWWLLPFQPGLELAGLALLLGAAAPFLVALNCLGREVALGTFSGLLSAPVARATLWRTKTTVLALAMLVLLGLWMASFFRFQVLEAGLVPSSQRLASAPLLAGVGLFSLSAYTGGLWAVLLFRQVAAAFWFAIFVPVALFSAVEFIFAPFPQAETAHWVALVLAFILYALAGFVWARRMFLRAQDAHWSGGMLMLPSWWIHRAAAVPVPRAHTMRAGQALWRKELQLHHGLFLLAGLLALMHLGVLGLRHVLPPVNPNLFLLGFLLSSFWSLWLTMPLLIGCTTVADERKLGTLESAACLPVSRGGQFRIKFLFVLLFGGLMGAIMPWWLEGIEGAFGAVLEHSQMPPWLASVIGGGWLLLAATGIGTVSFYASTLARNLLQALGLAIALLVIALIVATLGAQPEVTLGIRLWSGPLFGYISALTLFVTLVALGWWNFKRGQAGQTLWRRNLAVLALALVFIVLSTAGIYHRVWEIAADEPVHRPPQLRQADVSDFATRFDWTHILRLSDGRLGFYRPALPASGSRLPIQARGAWVEGDSKWIGAAVFSAQLAAIRSDGTLWVSEPRSRLTRTANGLSWENAALVRAGNATNWLQISSTHFDQGMLLLLSDDGMLWRWGHHDPARPRSVANLTASEPVRWGTDTDWAEIIPVRESWSFYLRKRDGSVWGVNTLVGSPQRFEMSRDIPLQRWAELEGANWREIVQGQPFQLGLQENGTLWAFGMLPPSLRRLAGVRTEVAGPRGIQVGTDSDWRSIAAWNDSVIGLKTDGSLWRWDFGYFVRWAGPFPIGRHRDWVAVGAGPHGLSSLAADGSLWIWYHSLSLGARRGSAAVPVPYLGPSRIPESAGDLLANVGSLPLRR